MSEKKPRIENEISKPPPPVKPEKDHARVCPTKLTKRELEELYFALVDNNTELKKSLNQQLDKVRQLNTKVARLANIQKSSIAKDGSGRNPCCATTRAAMAEQNISILDLKKANERLGERVRALNMRLCSARQFLKKASPQPSVQHRCSKCNSGHVVKDAAVSPGKMLPNKIDGTDVAIQETPEFHDVETNMSESEYWMTNCKEECKTMMGGFQEKITALEDELSATHKEYSSRINRLEQQLERLQEESMAARAQRNASETDSAAKLAEARAIHSEIAAQLSMEKKKVAELETQLKSAQLSNEVAKTIETHLSNEVLRGRFANKEAAVNTQSYTPEYIPEKEVEDNDDPEPKKCCSIPNIKVAVNTQTPLHIPTKGVAVNTQSNEPEAQNSCVIPKKAVAGNTQNSNQANIPFLYKEAAVATHTKAPNNDLESRRSSDYLYQNDLESRSSSKEAVVSKLLGYESVVTTTRGIPDSDEEAILRSPATPARWGGQSESPSPAAAHAHQRRDDDDSGIADKSIEAHDDRADKINRELQKQIDDLQKQLNELRNSTVEQNRLETLRKSVSEKEERDLQDVVPTGSKNEQSTAFNRQFQIIGPEPRDQPGSLLRDKDSLDDSLDSDEGRVMLSVYDSQRNMDPVATERVSSIPKDSIEGTENYQGDEGRKLQGVFGGKRNIESVAKDCVGSVPEDGTKNDQGPKLSFVTREKYEEIPEQQNEKECGTCPHTPRTALRDLTMFRSGSGSLRFTTSSPAAAAGRACAACQQRDAGSRAEAKRERKGRPTSDAGTYTIEGPASARSEAPSPDSTHYDVSSIADSHPKSRSAEDNDTSTRTSTEMQTSSREAAYLSEGEVPRSEGERRFSAGEKPLRRINNENKLDKAEREESSGKMQSALQAIKVELARCRRLMQAERQESAHRADPDQSDSERQALRVRRAPAARLLSDSAPRRCAFTLHIGTIVLSDEAVMQTREKTLVLTWRFYGQSPAMVRLCRGRIVRLHFATEYDVTVSDQLLRYLKHEELPIHVCEAHNPDRPLARALLRLRDTLLNLNRRVDMSLALMAVGRAGEGGEGLGVLDLWCALRADPSILDTTEKSANRPSDQWSRLRGTSSNVNTKCVFGMLRQENWRGVNDDMPERDGSGTRREAKVEQMAERDRPGHEPDDSNQCESLNPNESKKVTIGPNTSTQDGLAEPSSDVEEKVIVTVLWLALDEGSAAMADRNVRRLYVAYSFLGRWGAELETAGLPKPRHPGDRFNFHFKKTFPIGPAQRRLLAHMGRRHAGPGAPDCIVFACVSEPEEDPLGLASCVDVGYAYLYLGDLLACCAGDSYTEMLSVHEPHPRGSGGGGNSNGGNSGTSGKVCGVLAVRIDGLDVVRRLSI